MAHCGGFEVSSKYQREIEEILKEAGDIGGGRKPKSPSSDKGIGFFRLVWLYVRQSLGGRFWSISPGRVMLLGFVLLLSALLVIPLVGGRGRTARMGRPDHLHNRLWHGSRQTAQGAEEVAR